MGLTAWAGRLMVVCGFLLLPWLYMLATGQPDAATAAQWPVAWVGLDALESVGLIATGAFAIRGDRRYPLVAAATATLLAIDAWFDTTTAAAGSAFVTAAVMASCVELPLAALCARLAMRAAQQALVDGGGSSPTGVCGARGARCCHVRQVAATGERPRDEKQAAARVDTEE
ncbi:hypothetical protein [Streptomyces sp. NPDC001083]|uniref:hypothetical protein n=1 Tax=Streptomyces sp. NPDC001083 TaxID=3364545 RepID=UPI0036B9A497